MDCWVILFSQNLASTRYRILEFLPRFQAAGHNVRCVWRSDLKFRHLTSFAQADVVVCQKCLMGQPWAFAIRAAAKRLVFDWDDAFWTRGGGGAPYGFFTQQKVNARIRWWLKHADVVTCPNECIAAYSRQYSQKVEFIRNTLDLSQWQRTTPRDSSGPFIVGWSGAAASAGYLRLCDEVVGLFLQRHPAVQFRVLCNRPPKLKTPFQFIEWSPEREKEFIASLSVGLLPLPEEKESTHGKSPIKALQYMSMGVPVVGNMNKGGPAEMARAGGCVSVSTADDWLPALEGLLDPARHRCLSEAALANVRANHDQSKVFERMVSLWRGQG